MFLTTTIFLTGCQDKKKITVMVPQGSPELASIYIKNDTSYAVDTIIGADPLVAAFSSQSHDVIIAPTNLGAKLYQNKPSYIMLGVLVEGNYYFASRNLKIDEILDIEGSQVIVFGKNQTADIIVSHLFMEFGVTCQITYVDNITTATAMLVLDPNLIILTAEPSLSVLVETYPDLKILDLMPIYEALEGETYPQASIFIKANLDYKTIDKIRVDFENSANRVNTNPKEAAEIAVNVGVMLEAHLIEQAVLRSHINYHDAWDAKPMIERYFLIIDRMNPALIGHVLPDDSFYYRGDNRG